MKVYKKITGVKIWDDTDGTVDIFVSVVGTGGTIDIFLYRSYLCIK